MAISEGSGIVVAYKKQTDEAIEATGADGKILRRATATLDLAKNEVPSAEKRLDFQEQNSTHGTRSVNLSIDTELFGGDLSDFLAALCRRDFTDITTITAAAGDGFSISGGVLTRQAGGSQSFITQGLYRGLIARLTNGSTIGNNNRNVRIISATATTLGLLAQDGGVAIANETTPDTDMSLTIPGAVTFVPLADHTSDVFTIERHDRKLDVSQVATACRIGSFSLNVQPDQAPSVTIGGLGVDMKKYVGAAAPSLTSPVQGNGPLLAAALGYARVGSTVVATITGFTLDVDLGVQNGPVAFSDVSPGTFYGRVASVTGSITILRDSLALWDAFDQETEVSLEFYLEAPGPQPRQFFSVFLPRVKINSADLDDPDGPVSQTCAFRALRPAAQATGLLDSVMLIQDSLAVGA